MSELKPCPFCGGEATGAILGNTENIGCIKCNASIRGPLGSWNTRHTLEALQAQVDALTRALEGMVRTSALAPDSLERAVARMAGEVALSLQRDTKA